MSSKTGFTLLEVIIASFILTIGVVGAFTLIQRVSGSASIGSNQLVASYLVQEGIEIVRNIRDSNFIRIHKGLGGSWDDGLTGCVAGCEADYNDTALSVGDRFLLLDANGWYTYDSGIQSSFKRKITITSGADKLIVTVDVSWMQAGMSRKVTGETELYNWLTP